MNAPKSPDRQTRQKQQHDHHTHSQSRTVQAEEGRGPKCVGGKLPAPKPNGRSSAETPPDQPSGNADHHIQHSPDRCEHPGRRRSGRCMQRLIPMMDRMRRHRSANGADQQAQADESHQCQRWGDRNGGARKRAPVIWTRLLEDTAPFRSGALLSLCDHIGQLAEAQVIRSSRRESVNPHRTAGSG